MSSSNDEVINDWLWIDINNHINVLVTTMIDDQEVFVVFEQTKYGYNGLSYAPIGGHIDAEDNNDALKAAQRELLEELGMVSNEWINLGKYRSDVNRGGGFCFTFLARNAIQIENAQKYFDEALNIKKKHVTFEELIKYYEQGLFKGAKWSNTVGLSIIWMLRNTDIKIAQKDT